MPSPSPILTLGISSRALFNLDSCHAIFEQQGAEAYRRHQIAHENEVLEPGMAFALVKKLLAIKAPGHPEPVEVVLISRNSADIGLRIFHSMEHHRLRIRRAAFCGGGDTHVYTCPFGVHLFLSASQDDVQGALSHGVPAAVLPSGTAGLPSQHCQDTQVRIAFDGDAVIFDASADSLYEKEGLQAFESSEQIHASEPLGKGPFWPFMEALQRLQSHFDPEHRPIRTALVTARGAPAHERAIRTIREWGVKLDEVLFLGGLDKGSFLAAFGADIFFDDRAENCEEAAGHTMAGLVPNGKALRVATPAGRGGG